VRRGCPPPHRGRTWGRGRNLFGYFNVEILHFRGILLLTVKFFSMIKNRCQKLSFIGKARQRKWRLLASWGAWSPCPPSLNPPMLTETERGISATDTRHSNARTQCQLSRHVGRNKHTFSDSLTQQNTSDSAVILATCSDDRTTHDVKRNILSRSNAVRALPSQDQTQDFGIFVR